MARTEINTNQILDGSITNIDIASNASIAGTKISPSFGTQDVATTGKVSTGTLKVGSSSTIGHVLTATDTAGNVAFAAPAAGVSYPLLANPIGTAGAPAYSFSGDTNTGVFSPEADSIAFSTAGTERLRLDASGNLKVQDLKYIYWGLGAGVRITGDVMNGWMLFQGNAGESSLKGGWFNTPAGFAHTGPTTSGTPYFSLNSSYTMGVGTSGADIIDLITASTKRLTIDATGRVGIGTTTPDRPLHVVGGMRADTILGVSSIIAGSGLQFSYDTILAMQSTNDIKFNTWGGVERMRVDHTTGFVWFAKGIRLSGDTSGSVSLQAPSVAGTQAYTLPSADGTSGQVLSTNGTGTLSWATAAATTPGGVDNNLQYNSNGAFGGAAGLQYRADYGWLGIGKYPTSTLDIDGDFRASNSITSLQAFISSTILGSDASIFVKPVKIGLLEMPSYTLDVTGTARITGATIMSSTVAISGAVTIADGSQGLGKVLTSDANGVASWQTPSGGSDNHLNSGLADLAYSGITLTGTAGEALAAGDICYRKSDGKYWKANATSATAMPGIVLATAAISAEATGTFLSHGFYRNDTLYAWTPGQVLYASTTGGALASSAPSGSGNVVQAAGYAYSADIVYMMPSLTMVGVA